MRYENLKKEGTIQHPDKGELEITIIDGFIETPTIPTLSRHSGKIIQQLTTDKSKISVESSKNWLEVRLVGATAPSRSSIYNYTLDIHYQANISKKYRSSNLVFTIDEQRHVMEIIQRP